MDMRVAFRTLFDAETWAEVLFVHLRIALWNPDFLNVTPKRTNLVRVINKNLIRTREYRWEKANSFIVY